MIKFPPEIIKYVLDIFNTYMERIRTCHKGGTVSVFLRKPVDICGFLGGGGLQIEPKFRELAELLRKTNKRI